MAKEKGMRKMNFRKNRAQLLTAISLIICLAMSTAAFALMYVSFENRMRITANKELQVEKPLGHKIDVFDWGDFNKSDPAKAQVFYLRTFSNTPLNVNWTVDSYGMTEAYFFIDLNVTTFEFTAYNQVIPFVVNLTLIDYSAAPASFSFTLNFGDE